MSEISPKMARVFYFSENKEYFQPRYVLDDYLWSKIFSYVSVSDLKNLSLTCKDFNSTISIDDYCNKRMILKINSNMSSAIISTILESQRMYKNLELIEISSCDKTEYLKVIKKFGRNLRHLKLKECCLAKYEMLKIFNEINYNLRILELDGILTHSDDFPDEEVNTKGPDEICGPPTACTSKSIAFHRLDEVKIIESDLSCVLDLLPSNISKASFQFAKFEDEDNITHFNKFLKRQKGLKHLKIRSNNENNDHLESFDENSTDFKLSVFELSVKEPVDMTVPFLNFMVSQAATLEYLKLKNISIHDQLELFESMPKLKNLHLEFDSTRTFKSGIHFNCPMLKSLTFKFAEKLKPRELPKCAKFIERFSGLEEMHVKMPINSEFMELIMSNNADLRKLTLSLFIDKNFGNICQTDVTELIIENAEAYCSNIEAAFIAFKNLQVLKLCSKVQITAKTLLFIVVNFKKLKHLVIENGCNLKLFLLLNMADCFGHLETLKIWNMKGSYTQLETLLARYPKLKVSFTNKEVEKSRDNVEQDENSENSEHVNVGDVLMYMLNVMGGHEAANEISEDEEVQESDSEEELTDGGSELTDGGSELTDGWEDLTDEDESEENDVPNLD